MRLRLFPLLSLALYVLLAISGCGPQQPAPGDKPAAEDNSELSGHQRMVRLLGEYAEIARAENRYYGDSLARNYGEQLKQLPDSSPLENRWKLYRLAGVAELRAGNEEKGIKLLEAAVGLLPRVGSRIGRDYSAETIFRLGVGHMRRGETLNCCARFTPESCILPIQGGGIHTDPTGSREAIKYFARVMELLPPDSDIYMASRWLLNIAYMTIDGYPAKVPLPYLIPESAFRSQLEIPRFKNVAPRLGLDRFNCSGGVIIDDFNNDGYLDVLSSTWEPGGQLRLFISSAGKSFEDKTEGSGLEGLFGGLNLVQGDYDNDGNLDFLVLRGAWLGARGRHPNSLIRNLGGLKFEDVTFSAGLAEAHYPTQTAGWSDYDNDGDLDLYIGNETSKSLAAPCQLFRNTGNGVFEDVAKEAGVLNSRFTKGVTWGDIDNDGDQDLYVSNLGAENRLYRNSGDGTFTDIAPEAGVTRPLKSFPVWFWDYNNDGNLDIFASSYDGKTQDQARHLLGKPGKYESARLYRGDGKGAFTDTAAAAGLDFPMLPMGSNFGDLDGDGFLDFYLGTGDPEYASIMPNLMLLGRGGDRFVDVTMAGGFGHLQKGHAIAFADIDRDGDVDVFEQMGGAYIGDRYRDLLFENPGFGNRWIRVSCRGTRSNRSAIGTRIRVEVETDGVRSSIYRSVSSGGSFGASPLPQLIGLGKCQRVVFVEIRWPASGTIQRLDQVKLDSLLSVTEETSRAGETPK